MNLSKPRSDADLFEAVVTQDQRYGTKGFKPHCQKIHLEQIEVQTKHQDAQTEYSDVTKKHRNRSSQRTSTMVGTSATTVERIRFILDWAQPQIIESIRSGKLSLADGYSWAKASKLERALLNGKDDKERLGQALVVFARREKADAQASFPLGSERLDTLYRLARDLKDLNLIDGDIARAVQSILRPMRSKQETIEERR